MADMEHLFREQEIREMEKATGRPAFTERFKTALYRACLLYTSPSPRDCS